MFCLLLHPTKTNTMAYTYVMLCMMVCCALFTHANSRLLGDNPSTWSPTDFTNTHVFDIKNSDLNNDSINEIYDALDDTSNTYTGFTKINKNKHIAIVLHALLLQ